MILEILTSLFTYYFYKVLKGYFFTQKTVSSLPPRLTTEESEEYLVFLEKCSQKFRQQRKRGHIRALLFFSVIFGSGLCSLTIHSTQSTLETVVPPKTTTLPNNEWSYKNPSIQGVTMKHCLLVNDFSPYCYYGKLWSNPIRDSTTTTTTTTTTTRAYFVDEYRDTYFVYHALERRVIEEEICKGEDELHIVRGPVLLKEKMLRQLLSRLSTNKGEECICPTSLGIYDNVSFLHYHDIVTEQKQWIIMNDPNIQSIPSDAKRIRTRIEGSTTTLDHYDRFVVSFASLHFQFDETSRLREMNDKMYHYDEGEQQKQKTFILHRIERVQYLDRISIVLSGDNAKCFIYCQESSPPAASH